MLSASQFRYVLDTNGNHIFNEGGVNADFRVESDSNAHMLFVNGGNNTVNVGTSGGTQTIALLHTRKNGANIEFGHGNNSAGYFGTVGAFGNNGKPYIGFSTACENGANTFSTFGSAGNIIHGNLAGSLVFSTVGSASATGQTPVERWYMGNTGHFTPAQQHAYDIGGVNAEVRNIYAQGLVMLGGSGAANKLDDYEEGTFTSTIDNEANINSISSSATIRYRKVGGLVHIEFDFSGSFTNSTSEARFRFTVPFNFATTSPSAVGIAVMIMSGTFNQSRFTNGQIFQGTTANSSTYVYISASQIPYSGAFTGRATLTYAA